MHKRINCFISRANRALRFMFFVGLALTICFSSSVARALTEEELDRYAAYGIRFYNPSCTGGSVDGSEITYIGDSIGVAVYPSMKNIFRGIDGEKKDYDGTIYNLLQESKQFSGDGSGPNHDGITIAKKLKEKKTLRKYLIFALGTNGPGGVTESVLSDLEKAVGEDTKVLLVTNYGTKDDSKSGFAQNNQAMKTFASSHSNFAVADWSATVSSDAKKYIKEDGYGVHPTNDGVTAYTNLLEDTISAVWGGGGKGSSGSGTNRNYAGAKVFTDRDFEKINEYKSVYEAAANKYGFKWQFMAVIHSQEHELMISNPSNGQGIYQLYTYTNGGKNENAFKPTDGKDVSMDEFARQTDIAASFVADIAKNLGADMMTDQGAKEVLYQYNGKAKQYYDKAIAMGFSKEEASQGDGSAYVMNRFDARRDPTSSEMDPNWPGVFIRDGVYSPTVTSQRMGTFVKYAAIGGTGEDACKDDANDFIGYVKRYAWPDKKTPVYTERTKDYAEAIEARPASVWGQQDYGVPGIDCHAFVSTLIINSGVDPDYSKDRAGVTSGALGYLKNNKDKWELVNSSWTTPLDDESKLTPGDIALSSCSSTPYEKCKHTYVYIGEVEGFETHIASASTGKSSSRAPAAGGESIKGDGIVWFHRK